MSLVGTEPVRTDAKIDQALSGDYGPTIVNEGNLISLQTLAKVYVDDASQHALQQIAKEEGVYLMRAMRMLHPEAKAGKEALATAAHLRKSYTMDLKGAMALADVLKKRTVEKEADLIFGSELNNFAEERLQVKSAFSNKSK